jgi:thiol-disulfide isomerase/thioredoxin
MVKSYGDQLPDISNLAEWIGQNQTQGSPITVCTLIHFWAISCPACKVNMPHLQILRDTYGPYGLQVVAVHTPRGDFDMDRESVKKVAAEIGITEPCAIDNERAIGDAFGVDAWPAYYFFDGEGKLRRRAVGNFGVRMIEQSLIRQFGVAPESQPASSASATATPP